VRVCVCVCVCVYTWSTIRVISSLQSSGQCISHVPHIIETCHTNQRVMAHTIRVISSLQSSGLSMSHVPHVIESYHARK